VACFSKGRKLWKLALYSFAALLLVCLLWSCLWGGVGMRQARQAMELERLGEVYYNNSAHFLGDSIVFTNELVGGTPVCKFDAAHSDFTIFHVPVGGQGLGQVLTVLYLLGCTVFYITFSDSASFMLDFYASNGRKTLTGLAVCFGPVPLVS
jgi:choline-glycine betaine transporter